MQDWRVDGPDPARDLERLVLHGRYDDPMVALRDLDTLLGSIELDVSAVLPVAHARGVLITLAGAGRPEQLAVWAQLESLAADHRHPVWLAVARALRARVHTESGDNAGALGDLARVDVEALLDDPAARADVRPLFVLTDAAASAYAGLRLHDQAEQTRELTEQVLDDLDLVDRAAHRATWAAELATRAAEPLARGASDPDARLLDRAVALAEQVLAFGVAPVPEVLRRTANGVLAFDAAYRGRPSEALRLLGSDAFGDPTGVQPPACQLIVLAALHAHTLVGSHATARSLDDSVARHLGSLPSSVLEVCRARERVWLDGEAGRDPARAVQRLTDALVRLSWRGMELATQTTRQALEHQALRTESRTDPLTGVGNRRALDEDLRAMLRFSTLPVAMVLMDLDGFKQINDRHTHLTGDEVLRRVARCLAGHIGPEDRLARYGGDEFVVLLRGTGEAPAREAAQRLADAVHALPWDAVATGLRVRVTTGQAAVYALTGRRPDADAERLFRRADESLLEAKRRAQAPATPIPACPSTDLTDLSLTEPALIEPALIEPALTEPVTELPLTEPLHLLDVAPPVRRSGRRAAHVIDLTVGAAWPGSGADAVW